MNCRVTLVSHRVGGNSSGSIIANLLVRENLGLAFALISVCLQARLQVLDVYILDRANMYLFLAASAFAVAACA